MTTRGRLAVSACLTAGALLAALPAAATTAATIDDASGDTYGFDGEPAPAPQDDVVRVDIDATDGLDVTIEFATARSVDFFGPIVVVRSPYAGGGSGLFVTSSDTTTPDAPLQVTTFDASGSIEECADATTSGNGTTTLSISMPASCVNPPDEALVEVLVIGNEGTDILDARVIIETSGTGAHSPTSLVDGDPATTDRLGTGDPVKAAVTASQALFPEGAQGVILARSDVFADALAGSGLFTAAGGPLLYTAHGQLPDATAGELSRLLPDGAVIHVLGGTAAISDTVLTELRNLGFEPRRAAGADRIRTSIAVADRLLSVREVLLVRSHGPASDPNGTAAWADSIAVAPYAAADGQRAVVLVGQQLTTAHEELLDRLAPARVTIVGGTAAVPNVVRDRVAALGYPVRRVAGVNRSDTAARIERDLVGAPKPADLDPGRLTTGPRGVAVINGFHRDGWALGLAGSLAAATKGMPFVVVGGDTVPPEAVPSLRSCAGEAEVEVWLLGDKSHISDTLATEIDALDPEASC